jgi:hypothetical protein
MNRWRDIVGDFVTQARLAVLACGILSGEACGVRTKDAFTRYVCTPEPVSLQDLQVAEEGGREWTILMSFTVSDHDFASIASGGGFRPIGQGAGLGDFHMLYTGMRLSDWPELNGDEQVMANLSGLYMKYLIRPAESSNTYAIVCRK